MNPPPVPAPTFTTTVGMRTVELTDYAKKHRVLIPVPYDKVEMRKMVQAHMDTNKGNGGGKKIKLKTMKKKHS